MVGVIDEAFRSRIHLSLRFPSVNLQSTLEIWKMLLQRIESDNDHVEIKIKFRKDKLLKFAQKHYESHEKTESTWNGRQIRNAFQLAIAMDQYDRLQRIQDAKKRSLEPPKSSSYIQLRVENFKEIAKTAHEFETYMGSFMDSTSHRAKDVGVRNDYHDIQRRQEHRNRRGNEWLNLPTREPSRYTTGESSRRDKSLKGKRRENQSRRRVESGSECGSKAKRIPEQGNSRDIHSSDEEEEESDREDSSSENDESD